MSRRRFSERMLHKKCVITLAEKRLCGTAFQYYHICYHRIFFSLRWTRGHCLKKITVEQIILTRQIICQDQRLFVRKKKKDSETTSAICDHTRWPQRLPKGAVQKVSFRVSHLKLLVCPFVFVCVCACQLVPTLWVGHGAAAGEGQEDSAEDQTFQDETSAEGAPLCRCKAVWMRLFVCVPSLCVHETYLVIGYEQVCVFNRKSVCVCVFRAFTSMLCVCAWMFNWLSVFCLCGQAHLCA